MQASDLDGIVEDRANVLEVVSERLSKHVLANYDTFVRGINEAASVEADLQVLLTFLPKSRTPVLPDTRHLLLMKASPPPLPFAYPPPTQPVW